MSGAFVAGRSGLVLAVLGSAAVAALLASGSGYLMQVGVTTLVYVLLACSLNLVTGTAGMLSLGHMAFAGLGAYTSALLATRLGWPPALAMPAAAALVAAFGAAVALPTMRLSSIYFAVATLAIGELVGLVLLNWVGLTRGPMGLRAVPLFSLGGDQGPAVQLVVCAVVVAAALALIMRLVHSDYGRALRALREDEACAVSMGVDTRRLRLETFAISSFFAGLAGALLAHTTGYISPDNFRFTESVLVLAMVVVGGLGSVTGAAIGATLLVVVPELLRDLGSLRMIGVGLVLFLCILFLPRGLLGEHRVLRRRAHGATAPAARVGAGLAPGGSR
jgi:branched-chain amino acid transport system permease protein